MRAQGARILLLAVLFGTAQLGVGQVASSAPAPPEIQNGERITVDYFDSVVVNLTRNDADNTIAVEDDHGNDLECEEDIDDYQLRFYPCTLDLYTSAEQAGGTTDLSFYEIDAAGESSPPAVVTIEFVESRFQVTTPPDLPSGDSITLRGEREDGDITVQWRLQRGSTELLGGPQECEVEFPEDGGESETFACTYVDPDSARPEPSTEAVRPAAFFSLPTLLPGGDYTATIEEHKAGIVPPIDTVVFNFTVAGPAAGPPAGPPTGPTPQTPPPGGTPALQDRFSPIPLAPVRQGPVILGAPDETAPSTDPADPGEDPDVAASQVPVSTDILRILILAITAFTILSLVGPRGVATPRRLAWSSASTGGAGRHASLGAGSATVAAVGGGGEVEGADDDAGRDKEAGAAWGDRSITWRFPGWSRLDALSLALPARLSTRLPLIARVLSDAAYLRASLGMLWLLFPIGGVTLGIAAGLDGSPAPFPPALALTATLLVLAVLDSTAGVAAVLAFAAVTIAGGGLTADGLSLGQGVRGLLGLGALWFVTPLVAAAARPLRRRSEPGHVYGWDRFGDVVIAALLGGWAVQGIVGGLGDLTSRDLAITDHADALALLAVAAVVVRYGVEEVTAAGYPRRLAAVESAGAEPATIHHLRGLAVRSGLLAFFAGAFLGSCWQLWAGVAIFALPQLVALAGDRIPDVKRVALAVPRGVTQVLVLVLIGAAIAYLLNARAGDGAAAEREAIRTGFVLLSVPAAALELLSVLGGDGPTRRWTWPRQLAGAGIVVVTTAVVTILL